MMNEFSTKIAPRGAFCLGIAFGLSVVGGMIGDGVLITLGLSAVTLMICCYVLGRSNLYHLEADVSLPHKVHANKSYRPQVVIRNHRSLLDAFHVKLYLAFPHGAVLASQSAWVAAGSLASASLLVRIPMRHCSLEHPYKFSSTFPLGLFRFSTRQLLHHPLTIYPRSIIPDELLEVGASGQCQYPDQQSNLQHAGEMRSVRAWQPGDAAKNIHWPASIRSLAHGHGLRIREFDPPGLLPERAVIIFHSFSAEREMMREDTFERGISLIAGSIAYLRNLNIRADLVADFMGWIPLVTKTRPQYYECLSFLADGKRAVGTELHELQSAIDAISDKEQIIIISDMPPDAWFDLVQIPDSASVVDIRQVHFPVKKTISAKEALSQSA